MAILSLHFTKTFMSVFFQSVPKVLMEKMKIYFFFIKVHYFLDACKIFQGDLSLCMKSGPWIS